MSSDKTLLKRLFAIYNRINRGIEIQIKFLKLKRNK